MKKTKGMKFEYIDIIIKFKMILLKMQNYLLQFLMHELIQVHQNQY